MKAIFTIIIFLVAFHPYSFAQQNIVIPLNEWTSQRVLSQALGKVISDNGIAVDYVDISVDDQWGALKRGAIHFQLEVWEPAMKVDFNELVANNYIIDLGSHKATVIEDWWYPEYVEKFCPSLPNWTALNECVALFKKHSSDSKGIYFGGPWNYGDADIIRALDINFTINRLPNGLALWEQLAIAEKNEKPIILLNWSPNWTDKYMRGKYIEFPAYTEECERNPSWGPNKKYVKDCGNKRRGWLKKAAAHALKKANPCVYQFIKQVNFTDEMLVEASALVVVNKLPEKLAAKHWLEIYQSDVNHWRSGTCLHKSA